MAQTARLAIICLAIVLAGLAFLAVPGWLFWAAMLGVFIAGGVVSEAVFRRLATPEVIKADLEDRARSTD
jgi:hypothetical protein